MVKPAEQERNNNGYGSRITATRLVLLVNAPVLAVLGWMAIVLIHHSEEIATLKANDVREMEHLVVPWHAPVGIQLAEMRKDIERLRDSVLEIRGDVKSNSFSRLRNEALKKEKVPQK